MRLILFHPVVAARSCADCQAWMHDDQFVGDEARFGQRTLRKGEPVPRGNSPPPCWMCPKGSPEQAPEHEISLKNWQSLQLYREVQATFGLRLDERMRRDRRLMRNLAIIHEVMQAYKRHVQVTGRIVSSGRSRA